jgi:hypothetical protein
MVSITYAVGLYILRKCNVDIDCLSGALLICPLADFGLFLVIIGSIK